MRRTLALFALSAACLLGQTAETIPFRAVLLPTNEVPPANIEASGTVTVLAHVVRDAMGQVVSGSVDFLVNHSFPGQVTMTGMHIHRGAAGINGPVVINAGLTALEPFVSESGRGRFERQGQVRPNAADYTNALAALKGLLENPAEYYVNIHTPEFPGGAIRGQLQRAESLVLLGQMSSAKEAPTAPDVNATGVGAITAYVTRAPGGEITSAEVVFDISYSVPGQTTFTGLHIHRGAAGAAGPVTIGTDLSASAPVVSPESGAGTINRRVEVNLGSAAALDTLQRLFTEPESTYVNLHSTTFPGGIIRSQLHRPEQNTFPVLLATGNEVPAVDLDASAPGVVTIYALRADNGEAAVAMVDFDVNYRFPTSVQFTGFHIHDGVMGANGPVRVNTGLSGTNPVVSETGFGNLVRTVLVSSGTALATVNSALASPDWHYVNLHTTVHSGGAVRAQMGEPNTSFPVLTSVISAVSDPSQTTLASGSLFTLFGTNLAKVPASLAAFSGRTLPTSLNSVEVTVGGRPARIVQVTPTYVVAQVPFDLIPGPTPVLLTNANGRTSAFGTSIANTAPAIFFDADGGIVTDLNYRLVRADNPARSGDYVWVYSTGMGQTQPPLEAGDLRPISNPVQNVTATVGGQPAQVLYSGSAPGFAGLYQTAIAIPANLTPGNARVVLTVGGNSSNAVTIPVR